MPSDFWLEETAKDVATLRTIAQWTMTTGTRYTQQARTDFLANADYRLVAAAAAGRHVVVTHEVPAPESQRTIKIPDACAAFNVESCEPFRLFGELGLQLVRPPNATPSARLF